MLATKPTEKELDSVRQEEPIVQMKTGKKKVFIIEDHPLMVEGLNLMINRSPDLGVCGSADNLSEAIKLMDSTEPDVLLLDINLKNDENGLNAITKLRELFPKVQIVVHSMHGEYTYVERALNMGAKGYVSKREANENILTAIRKVLKNEVYLNPDLANRLVDRLFQGQSETHKDPIQGLSNRELEVFELIGKGASTKQIASALVLSVSTVETHRANIKTKLKLQTNAELVKAAVEWILHSTQGK